MARDGNGSANAAIFGMVALVLVGLLVFFLFFNEGSSPPADEPDIEIEIEPPAGDGTGDAEPLPQNDGGGNE